MTNNIVTATSQKNLATQNTNDFTIYENGDAFISQRKAASLLGVNANTFMTHLRNHAADYDTKQGLTPDLLQKCTQYYAEKGNITSIKFLGMLAAAGAKAFIYHQAGYQIDAKPQKSPADLTRLEILQMALESEQKLIEAEQKIEVMEPKAKVFDRLSGCDNSMTISDTAKQLGINPKQLFQWLSDNNWIFKRSPKTPWVGYQTRINSGFLEHRSIVVENKQGTDMTSMQVRVTPKGLTVLADKVSSGSDLQTEMF